MDPVAAADERERGSGLGRRRRDRLRPGSARRRDRQRPAVGTRPVPTSDVARCARAASGRAPPAGGGGGGGSTSTGITISTDTAKPGDTIAVGGTGFSPSEPVARHPVLRARRARHDHGRPERARVAHVRRFPRTRRPGAHTIEMLGLASGKRLSVALQVNPSSTTTTSTTTTVAGATTTAAGGGGSASGGSGGATTVPSDQGTLPRTGDDATQNLPLAAAPHLGRRRAQRRRIAPVRPRHDVTSALVLVLALLVAGSARGDAEASRGRVRGHEWRHRRRRLPRARWRSERRVRVGTGVVRSRRARREPASAIAPRSASPASCAGSPTSRQRDPCVNTVAPVCVLGVLDRRAGRHVVLRHARRRQPPASARHVRRMVVLARQGRREDPPAEVHPTRGDDVTGADPQPQRLHLDAPAADRHDRDDRPPRRPRTTTATTAATSTTLTPSTSERRHHADDHHRRRPRRRRPRHHRPRRPSRRRPPSTWGTMVVMEEVRFRSSRRPPWSPALGRGGARDRARRVRARP